MDKKKALVFVNIGTPEDLKVKSVQTYLKKFLMDKYVIDIPFLFRWILVNLIIVPFRAKKSLEAYKKIWHPQKGSPLEYLSLDLKNKLSESLSDFKVEYAMSYSSPFIAKTLDKLKKEGANEIYYLPMYPQYAESSTQSALDELKAWHKKNPKTQVKYKKEFYNDPDFLSVSSQKISKESEGKEQSHFLFSFHGLPEKHMKKLHDHCKNNQHCCLSIGEKNKNCYRAQCFNTAQNLAKNLNLKSWSVSFQSRLGRAQWISPYTVDEVDRLAKNGVKNLVVIPYAFTIDCLETLEEIEGEVKERFIEAGGESLYRVDCLNSDFSKVVTPRFLESFERLSRSSHL